MGIKDISSNVGKFFGFMGAKDERPDLPDGETRDKFLRSLRRQRRMQLEEIEKKQLQKQIAAFEKARFNKDFYGTKENKILEAKKMKLFEKQKNTVPNPMKQEGKMFSKMKMTKGFKK